MAWLVFCERFLGAPLNGHSQDGPRRKMGCMKNLPQRGRYGVLSVTSLPSGFAQQA